MTATITFDQAKADATLQGEMPDGRKLLLKRKGLKLTLSIGERQGEALLRRLDHGPEVRDIVREALEAVALAAGARATLGPGPLVLEVD